MQEFIHDPVEERIVVKKVYEGGVVLLAVGAAYGAYGYVNANEIVCPTDTGDYSSD